jgi:hypothetical protein
MSDPFVAKSTTHITPDVMPVIEAGVTPCESWALHTVKTVDVYEETV